MAITATRWTAAENKFRYNVNGTGAGATSFGAGLFGTDGFQPCDLGSGRTLWTCGDTFWAVGAGFNRGGCHFVRNSVGVTTGYDLSTATIAWYVGGNPTAYARPYFDDIAVDGVPYTKGTSGALRLDDRVLAWGALIRQATSFPFFAIVGSWAELLFNVDDTPDKWRHINVRIDLPHDSGSGGPVGPPLDPGDGFVYFFFSSGGWSLARTTRERAKQGDLTLLEWNDGQGGWKLDGGDRYGYDASIRANRGGQGTPRLRSDGRWQVTGGDSGAFFANVTYDQTTSLTGLFGPYDLIYEPTPQGFPGYTGSLGGGKFIYAQAFVPWLTWSGKAASDQFIIYSTNRGPNGESSFSDARYYWPEVLQVSGT